MNGLPTGWARCVLEEVVVSIGSGKSEQTLERRPEADEPGVLKISAVSWGQFQPSEAKAVRLERFRDDLCVLDGDLLMSRANTVQLVGSAVLVEGDHRLRMLPDKILRLKPGPAIHSKYCLLCLRSTPARSHIEAGATGTSDSMRNIGQDTVRSIPLALPPLAEQHRIVAKLDALQVHSDAAKAALDAIGPLLEKFRQSVLAAAFRGDLTRKWREEHPDVEPASVLLERIRAERRRKWEEANPRKKYVEPVEPDLSQGALSLPETWAVASVAEISECLDRIRRPVTRTERRSGPYPYFGANGQVDSVDDYLFDEDLVLVTEDETFYGRTKPIAYRVSGKCWVNNHAHVLRPVDAVPIDYLWQSLMHYHVEPWLSGTTGRAKLTQAAMNSLPIALAPAEEMEQIATRVAELLSTAGDMAKSAESCAGPLSAMNQSILAKAFRGELVPQDPNDEPASVLLERIRREREGVAVVAGKRGRPARSQV